MSAEKMARWEVWIEFGNRAAVPDILSIQPPVHLHDLQCFHENRLKTSHLAPCKVSKSGKSISLDGCSLVAMMFSGSWIFYTHRSKERRWSRPSKEPRFPGP